MIYKSAIMDEQAMDRAMTRIAHEIIEHNKGLEGVILVGIRRRGVPFSERLAAKLEEFENVKVETGVLDITHYRDDLSMIADFPQHHGTELFCDINGKKIVLVDDVLYTGRTARCAIEALFDYGRPQEIQLAVMIDRGHRELPIRPDYVGKNVPTSRSESVSLKLKEIDNEDSVSLYQLEDEEIAKADSQYKHSYASSDHDSHDQKS